MQSFLKQFHVELTFERGSLELRLASKSLGLSADEPLLKGCPGMVFDERTLCFRAFGYQYRAVVEFLRQKEISYNDLARKFLPTSMVLKQAITARTHQQGALDSWLSGGGRGVVVLPTGAGKTILAVLAISRINRPTLVHVPTLDLLEQWKNVLESFFNQKIGCVGGGIRDYAPLTVTTYDSALRTVPFKGNAFGFAIFDECHHLPAEFYRGVAQGSIAPYRLGLTATPDQDLNRSRILKDIVGPICFESKISELSGGTLAPYEVHTIGVTLSEDENTIYQEQRKCYLEFVKANGIDFRRQSGWQDFIRAAARTQAGRQAFKAYRKQKAVSMSAQGKMQILSDLLLKHSREQIIIFTHDNAMAYEIGERFLLPVVTHLTHGSDREAFLRGFRSKVFGALVTSKVLNEGVDVPEASVGIVVSGSGTVREHVQRLGRILRASQRKKALLYELVSQETAEEYVNQRRKNHDAYQGSSQVP